VIWQYTKNVLIALDQLVNAMLGGFADETLSSRAWRNNWNKPIDWLFSPIEKDHCFESYVSEQLRLQCPPELRP
jgi:hypothetical protein